MLAPALFLTLLVSSTLADDLPPSCSRDIFCNSTIMHVIQMARLYQDSKTFVDLVLKQDEKTIMNEFDTLLNETDGNPTREQLQTFVNEHFDDAAVLEDWVPTDYQENPKFLTGIKDPKLREFGKNINNIWPSLGRKVKPEVFANPELYSIVPVTHGFIIPGGRFTELYYWDTYWIIEGLLISGMTETAKGVIENLIELLKKFGHIPNGSRWYYEQRSQPPLLTAMVALYFRETNDMKFLLANIKAVEQELNYWLDTQIVTFDKDDSSYTLLRYYAPSSGPRPESYYEDYTSAQSFHSEERKTEFYIDIKSAAESGWDFSSRWFVGPGGENTGNLTSVHTRYIIPVDLNAIFANALQNLAYFQAKLYNPRKAAHWAYVAKQWRNSIEKVLWNEEAGVWFDYNIDNGQHRKYFYPSNVAPLWMGAVEKRLVRRRARKILSYLRDSQGLDFPGGVPTSLIRSGEQWDFPNAWPPLVGIIVNALEALGTDEAKKEAFQVAQNWVRACHKGFESSKQMFEKYDVEIPGQVGGGGEYTVQNGFGWSNGVVLEFLAKYGRTMTASDDARQVDEVDSKSINDNTASSKDGDAPAAAA